MRAAIWILEDDRTFGLLLLAALARMGGRIEVRLFENGEAALESPGVPDIILADTNLGGRLTGPQVVKVMRERNPDLAVVFSSNLGRPTGIPLWPRDRDLPKPFSTAALIRQLSVMVAEIPRLQIPQIPPRPPSLGMDTR
jgi:DNA-binding NtrC family response regulator